MKCITSAGGKAFDHAGIRTNDLAVTNQKQNPLAHQALLVPMLQPIL